MVYKIVITYSPLWRKAEDRLLEVMMFVLKKILYSFLWVIAVLMVIFCFNPIEKEYSIKYLKENTPAWLKIPRFIEIEFKERSE
jgi:hypothetical protein